MENNDKRVNRLVSIPPKFYSEIEEIAKSTNLTPLKAGRLCMLVGIYMFKDYKNIWETINENKNLSKLI